ncbi:hypothetical protein PL373_04105 [Tenacibaculum maritimum]|nr:hypothetical protein [Tenacibaculum maritimum]
MQEFIIKEDLLRAINGYLGEQPFKDVAGIIGALSQLQPVEKKEKLKEDKK